MEFMDNIAFWCDDIEGVNLCEEEDGEEYFSIEFSNDPEIRIYGKNVDYILERMANIKAGRDKGKENKRLIYDGIKIMEGE